jgi:lipoprotein-releasing system ATP-binding protein
LNNRVQVFMAPIVRAINVHRYLGQAETATHILKGVHVDIGRGEYVSIVGPSGSGKSTLLYLLGGLDRPSKQNPEGVRIEPASQIVIDGIDTSAMNEAELALARNEKVGFVFQFHYLLKEFSAAENVALPMLKLGRLGRKASMQRAVDLLSQFGLAEKATRRANRLSGGEQQRVAIARALANEPAVVLADEPTGNLDKKNADNVAEIFDGLAAAGQTIVYVTHDRELAARAVRQIRMEDGLIVSDTTRSGLAS